ncbi:sensor histidine kinase [Sphaerisporangium perillae]|uniref:sensor histidine kinase n=1 Tax=Sphaerisporangium perillae TaxID=2935860 RepID=UPI00200CB187|nr:ATP-binding protein [Sphaerisporangium perillae]
MSVITWLAGRIARPHLPRRTVRLRMTLLYGGLFLVSGAALLAVTYVLMRHAVSGPIKAAGFILAPGTEAGRTPSPNPEGPFLAPPDLLGGQSAFNILSAKAAAALERQQSAVLQQLLIQSGIALALMSLIALVLGWIVAGRILRPLRTITAAARDISATSLHQRLALDGPGDELKELGDTFDGLLSRLEASFQAQRQFVANASHELRTPLARQRALGQVALSDPDATAASLREAHERIIAAGAQQERLIEALLTLTRGQAGIDARHPFDLARLTREVVDARRSEAGFRDVTIRPSISAATAAGHRPLAERLVVNLVDNALRHNTPGGRVEVTTRAVDGHAVLTVANTGPVVPPEAVEQIFEPFQRLGTARTGRGEGLGLGLSIVRAIATAHDATVTTTARPEGGLTVVVTFPAMSTHAPLTSPRLEQVTARTR